MVVGSGVALRPRRLSYGWLAVSGVVVLGSLLTLATPAHYQHWQPAMQLSTVARLQPFATCPTVVGC